VSETDSLTLNSPTATPPVKLTKYLSDFPAYSSKRSELYSFLNQLQNKLNGNIDCYPTPDSQLYYAINCLKGDTVDTIYLF